nr:tryptophan 2,3-dioxygenase family protein [Angustibacter aerolatus]
MSLSPSEADWPGEPPTYATYLHLDHLLSLQHPLAADVDPRTRAAEHFFIIVHQASELWLQQVLLDLDAATAPTASTPPGARHEHLARAEACLHLMTAQVEALDHLPPDAFRAFRAALGTASGAQSQQFEHLRARLAPAAEHADLLRGVAAAFARWQRSHLAVVARLLGDDGGTGGTPGVTYLQRRVLASDRVHS